MASQTYYQRDNQAGTLATVEYDGNRLAFNILGKKYCSNKAIKIEMCEQNASKSVRDTSILFTRYQRTVGF